MGRTNKILDEIDKKKQDSDKKRVDAMKRRRHEFNETQKIIKTALAGIDTNKNKKIVFSDNEEEASSPIQEVKNKKTKKQEGKTLFDDDDSDGEINFEVKEQFEGKKGQKVLDLQSRYKSDKRFKLDERFIEEESEGEGVERENGIDKVEGGDEETDEKSKQLAILEEVLGVTIKPRLSHPHEDSAKKKKTMGMIRFDPSNPEHAKFLAPVEVQQKKPKKMKKAKQNEENVEEANMESEKDVAKIEVSKEQFYKVSETLKESIAQPTAFSLRSLFPNVQNDNDGDTQEKEIEYTQLQTQKESKLKNPLDPGEKNPFKYDSSDSETEEVETEVKHPTQENTEIKSVFKETFFFTKNDVRFKEGLAFFNKPMENDVEKKRRELRLLMKKRMYNTTRKNQMFQKKIGGRKKKMYKNSRR